MMSPIDVVIRLFRINKAKFNGKYPEQRAKFNIEVGNEFCFAGFKQDARKALKALSPAKLCLFFVPRITSKSRKGQDARRYKSGNPSFYAPTPPPPLHTPEGLSRTLFLVLSKCVCARWLRKYQQETVLKNALSSSRYNGLPK